RGFSAPQILPATAHRYPVHLSSERFLVSDYRLKRRVLFYETDLAGIVHFSCYFRYMEEAEHALWRQAGLSIAPKGAEIGFPRVAASLTITGRCASKTNLKCGSASRTLRLQPSATSAY